MTETKKRIVVKVGSSSLASPQGGCDLAKMESLVTAIGRLRASGHEVCLVSSGAVASGYRSLGYQQRPRTLVAKQAAAAIGQSMLMRQYTDLFSKHEQTVAQILLTRSDFSDQERYRHAFETLSLLLKRGILPIINENDTVSVSELTFGDNDMLGALVAGLVHADLYMMLTDINGLYDKDPRKYRDAQRIPFLTTITTELEDAAGNASTLGTGGMRSKLNAAQTVQKLGIPCFIGQYTGEDGLIQILGGNGDGTYVSPSIVSDAKSNISTRKQWIALHSPISGRIYVDSGAAEAILREKRSLLIAGVKRVDGTFRQGEVIEVFYDQQLIGRGITRHDAELLRTTLYSDHPQLMDEVIHRDNWVAFEKLAESYSEVH
ncbi:glutamate 5-kinase [Risungbinella massiliensis]|uniref:glutamate 5-kinase n=1 Tax=Risungbinella massiliensis TaxID=1329796 RepID=UPI0005CBC143|nr:glutamate 5-kinase [Risungbinella massiliensis]